MSKTTRIVTIALLLVSVIIASAACTKEIKSETFISVLAKGGISAGIYQEPSDENNQVEITFGADKSGDIMCFLYNTQDKDSAKKYYDNMRSQLADLANSGGVTGAPVESQTALYKKTVANYAYAENDGSSEGSYTVLVWSGKSTITVVANDASQNAINAVNQIIKDLGYGE
jgi:preprotein translocase subunit SecD